MTRETNALTEIIHLLPKTADGETFIPGMGVKVYHPDPAFINNKGQRTGHPVIWNANTETWEIFGRPVSECYWHVENAGAEPAA